MDRSNGPLALMAEYGAAFNLYAAYRLSENAVEAFPGPGELIRSEAPTACYGQKQESGSMRAGSREII